MKDLISCPSTYFPWAETWESFQPTWYNQAIVINISSKAKFIERKIELDSLIFRKLILLFNSRLYIATKNKREKPFFPLLRENKAKVLFSTQIFLIITWSQDDPFVLFYFFFLFQDELPSLRCYVLSVWAQQSQYLHLDTGTLWFISGAVTQCYHDLARCSHSWHWEQTLVTATWKKIKHPLMIDKCVLLATAKKRLTCTNNKKAMLVTMGLKTKHPVTALVGKLANNVPFPW